MKSPYSFFLGVLLLSAPLISCQETKNETPPREVPVLWETFDETAQLETQQAHESGRMQYKLLQSKFTDRNDIFSALYWEVTDFPQERYDALVPLILEKDILSIQQNISEGNLTYEELTLFYLKRIYLYELNPETTLYTIIALNPDALNIARQRDAEKDTQKHPIYGMPILLKDNINTANMNTTAGAIALKDNLPPKDAFVVSQLKRNGAIILGKVNLSEWAYYFCQGCPLGYSAVGGQTLNPYGRKQFETGGSSAGSGTATAANYAIAAVGTETAGSIISPTSQNSLVGLKPTIGVISRTGIVPISHSLDTSGPMAKNATDAAILLDAMSGKDTEDPVTLEKTDTYISDLTTGTLKGKRFGVFKGLLDNPIYAATVQKMEDAGAVIVKIKAAEIPLPQFGKLLDIEMKEDIPVYLTKYASSNISVKSISDIVIFNQKDSTGFMPYNQAYFDGIAADSTSKEDFIRLREILFTNGTKFFKEPMDKHQLDAIVSINNYHSGYAAVAKYPCLALPMGYQESGEPIAITFIGQPFSEKELLKLGYAYEQLNPVRKIPADFSK